jgi:hypothetical protein
MRTGPAVRVAPACSTTSDASLINALQKPGIRRALKNAGWRDAIEEGAAMTDRDIPALIHLIQKIAPQQWEALLSTAKAFAGVT